MPRAGDTFIVAPDDRTARQIAEKREAADRQASLAKARKRISLEDLNEHLAAGKVETLNLILKGDVSGSVEALEDALLQIDAARVREAPHAADDVVRGPSGGLVDEDEPVGRLRTRLAAGALLGSGLAHASSAGSAGFLYGSASPA